jgi:type II restriction/modification system DNA methylase subunit YeeA
MFEAWSDEAWVIDGAAVRVSLVCFSNDHDPAWLNGKPVSGVNADLTSGSLDLTKVRRLAENLNIAFMGDTKGGAFDVPGELARGWLKAPGNPNGRTNADVLKPWRNGMDITRRPRDMWIIDFGWEMSESEASLFEVPFEYAVEKVKPFRVSIQGRGYARRWWVHERPRPEMWAALAQVTRYIATPTIAKHRLFVWLDAHICPDHQLIVITRDDDTTFGILHSRFHESWSLRCGTWLGVGNDPRYTPTTTFETFPFPDGLTPNVLAKNYAKDHHAIQIAVAAKRLDNLRDSWLNPPSLVRIEPEVAAGYPDRVLAKDAQAAVTLRQRTLTNLYNERSQWLVDAHRDLDSAVAAAYGWPADISEDDALAKLLELNLKRAGAASANVAAGKGYENSEADGAAGSGLSRCSIGRQPH